MPAVSSGRSSRTGAPGEVIWPMYEYSCVQPDSSVSSVGASVHVTRGMTVRLKVRSANTRLDVVENALTVNENDPGPVSVPVRAPLPASEEPAGRGPEPGAGAYLAASAFAADRPTFSTLISIAAGMIDGVTHTGGVATSIVKSRSLKTAGLVL